MFQVQTRHILPTVYKAHWWRSTGNRAGSKCLSPNLLRQHRAHVTGTSYGSGLCGQSLRKMGPGTWGGLAAVERWAFSWLISLLRFIEEAGGLNWGLELSWVNSRVGRGGGLVILVWVAWPCLVPNVVTVQLCLNTVSILWTGLWSSRKVTALLAAKPFSLFLISSIPPHVHICITLWVSLDAWIFYSYGQNCVPPKCICWSSNQSMLVSDCIWRWGL